MGDEVKNAEREISSALALINQKVYEAKSKRKKDESVCIVAVSKTKPKSMIIEAYSCGHRDFGENYVNELHEKACDAEVLEMCPDIKWHYIGHLQSNKVNKLLSVPNLRMIHSIDSIKLADLIDKAWSKKSKPELLNVLIQVNISEEDSKSGVSKKEMLELVKHVIENCSHLHFSGLMLIGYANYDLEAGRNPEFEMMAKYKEQICQDFHLDSQHVALSMGMSGDYEHAIELGSNYVRIGSSIFGSRITKTK